MVNIQPVQLFTNYGVKDAVKFDLIIIQDNLESIARFQYNLLDIDEVILYSNNLIMEGQDYIDWNNENDINQAAYVWAANELGLTIV